MSSHVKVFAPRENVNDESVTVVELSAAEGEFVAEGAQLLLLETSKSTFEVYAPQSGYVKYLVQPQADVPIDEPLCLLSESPELVPASDPAPANVAYQLVHLTTDCRENISRDPAVIAALLPMAGIAPDTRQSPAAPFPMVLANVAAGSTRTSLSAPSAKRASANALVLMEKFGLQFDDFPSLSMIRTQDVLARAGQSGVREAVPLKQIAVPSRSAVEIPPTDVPCSLKKLSRSKRTEIARLVSGSASLTSQVSVLVPSRGLNGSFAADPGTVGQMSSRLIFEVARLLKQFPDLNARYEPDHVGHYDEVNVGYALDLGQGLRVPVFRRADVATLDDIHRRKQDFIQKYLDGELTAADLDRGTFTITDLSSSGAWTFNPLVSAHQTAILGVGGEQAIGGEHFVYPLMLAFDHRVTDGLSATRFLHALSERLSAHESVLEGQLGRSAGGPAGTEPYCRDCRRTLSELKTLHAYLLRTVVDHGQDRIVCTICADGN